MKKLMFLSIWLFCVIHTMIAQENTNMTPKITKSYVITEKNAGAAFIMSMVVPGSGQMYCGKVGRGLLIFLGIPTASVVGGVLGASNDNTTKYIGHGLIIAAALAQIAQLIDAPLTAQAVNKRNALGIAQRKVKWEIGGASDVAGLAFKIKF
jgi:TM2 domain-containing membrane protein YozV